MKIALSFPDKAEFDYWYLYWIGNPFMENKKMKCNLYFINTRDKTDQTKNLSSKKLNFGVSHVMSIGFQDHIIIEHGSIFDRNGNCVARPVDFNRSSYSLTVDADFKLQRCDDVLINELNTDYIKNSQYPLFNLDDFKNSKLLIVNRNISGKEIRFLIPATLLASFFFGFSSNVFQIILENRLSMVFNNDDVAIIDRDNEKILAIQYDNRLLSEREMKFISNYFVLKENSGPKSINYFGNSLLRQFLNNERFGIVDFKSMFNESIKVKVLGKSIAPDLFIVYNILSLDGIEESIAFKEVELYKKFPSQNQALESTGDIQSQVTPIIENTIDHYDPSQENGDRGNSFDPNRNVEIEMNKFQLNIKKTLHRKSKLESGTKSGKNKSEIQFEEGNTDVNGNANNESLYLNFCMQFEVFPRKVFIEKIADELLKKGNEIRYIHLSNQIKGISFFKDYFGKNREIVIVEINKDGKFSYLFELTFGHTHLIRHLNPYEQLTLFDFDLFLTKIFRFKSLSKQSNEVLLTEFPTGYFYDLYPEDPKDGPQIRTILKHPIFVYPGIEHQSKGMENFDSLISHTLKKIEVRLKR